MNLTNISTQTKYSSRYLVEQINIFRKAESNKVDLLHFNFIIKIEKEFEEEIGDLKIQATSYLDASNRQSKQYELNFEQALQMLMSESKTVRKQCIVVMQKQQNQIVELTKPKELSRKDILLLALESEERAIIAEAKLIEVQPKVEFAETVSKAVNDSNFNDFAKAIDLGRNKLFTRCRNMKLLMENNRPYQTFVDRGYFKVIESTKNSKNFFTTVITAKGQLWLHEQLNKK